MSQCSLAAAYAETARLVALRPELASFGTFDTFAPASALEARPVPAIPLLRMLRAKVHPDTAPLVAAVIAMAEDVHWRRPYSEEDVGRDFLERFCSMELVGPTGHFRTSATRAFVAFWDSGLHYPWHLHEAEELYFILAGEALFEAQGAEPALLQPGDSRYHESNQPHAMTTTESQILALVLWRGSGLDGGPRIGQG